MPLLAGLVAGLFSSIAEFFGKWVAKKTAFGLAAVSLFGGLTVALMAAMTGLINGVLALDVLPDPVIFGMWYFMPSSLPAAFAAIVSAHVAVALYRWNVENIKLMSYVT